MSASAIIALVSVCVAAVLALLGGIWALARVISGTETRLGERIDASARRLYDHVAVTQAANIARFDCHARELTDHRADIRSMRRICDERHGRRRAADESTTALVRKGA
jgi:hypothetical protein